jgi:hypothetical protein
MQNATAGNHITRGLGRVLLGGGAAIAVIATAIIITVVGNAHEAASLHPIAATRPSHHGVDASERSLTPTPLPRTTLPATATEPTTTLAPSPAAPTRPAVTFPAATPTTLTPTTGAPVPSAPTAPPVPKVAINGPTVVSPGGQYRWQSRATGAVRGVWSGTVLSAEKGQGATSPWSAPSGIFVWDNPTPALAGGTYTITLTVYNAAGQSAQATEVVSYPRQ